MRINTKNIEGYDSMTAEEKLKALESFDIDMSGYVSKDQFDKASSQIADFKKRERASMDESERFKAEQTEAMEKMQAELTTLRTEKQTSEFKAQYLSLGYDDKSANEAAKASVEGRWEKVFQLQKENIEKANERLKSEMLANTPKPGINSGSGSSTVTKEQFDKMNYSERAKLYDSDKELYDQLAGE